MPCRAKLRVEAVAREAHTNVEALDLECTGIRHAVYVAHGEIRTRDRFTAMASEAGLPLPAVIDPLPKPNL